MSEETNCNWCTAAYLFTYCCLLLPGIEDVVYKAKIIFGLVCIDRDELFQLRLSTTRGRPYKLYKHFSSCSVRSSFFL